MPLQLVPEVSSLALDRLKDASHPQSCCRLRDEDCQGSRQEGPRRSLRRRHGPWLLRVERGIGQSQTDEMLEKFAARKAEDRRIARHKFFPEAKRRRQEGSDEPGEVALTELLEKIAPGVHRDETGLPAAHLHHGARMFQTWCREGSWHICSQCHRLEMRKLLPMHMRKKPTCRGEQVQALQSRSGVSGATAI